VLRGLLPKALKEMSMNAGCSMQTRVEIEAKDSTTRCMKGRLPKSSKTEEERRLGWSGSIRCIKPWFVPLNDYTDAQGKGDQVNKGEKAQ